MKKIRIGLIISFLALLISCKEKNKTILSEEKKEVIFQNEVVPVQAKNTEQVEETIKEQPRREIKNPLVFYKQYDFMPIEDIDIKSVLVEKTDENDINIIYNEENVFSIHDIGFDISTITNYCEPYLNERLFSSFFVIHNDNKKYYSLISFSRGFVKIFTCEESISPLFYSGYSDFFIFENNWISKESYYDYKTFKTIPAELDSELYLINILTEETAFSIASKLLHENVKLSIDKIDYENDGFRVTIGNCMDSDEFVDFKIYTANNEFHYEIYDKFTYNR